ncbi:B-cell antigen receptor complex-associated protein alpha chain isoform X2 [Grus americana]|uniref:B-cell antigen receptor complex-associated protein alpha chain isoform X2 n=1 Tax=Grus americana TaxID=9117 RepID=UPI00240777C9|nr:B-cell antigen receptor complex-associated protein alpha chain isoform X2 [Grus americana]
MGAPHLWGGLWGAGGVGWGGEHLPWGPPRRRPRLPQPPGRAGAGRRGASPAAGPGADGDGSGGGMAGAPPKWGAPLPLLLCLLPGCLCWKSTTACQGDECAVTSPLAASRLTPRPLTVESNGSAAACCCHRAGAGTGAVMVEPGPTSRTAIVGDHLSLECRFQAPRDASVTWYHVCPHRNCSYHPTLVDASQDGRQLQREEGRATLTFLHLAHNDTGLYYCRVQANQAAGQSCGTFLWVRDPMAVPFLNIKESTKNRIITAEGILLLLCAVGPGLFLLFRKRWANERLLQMKKSALEEENLYEGLNLDECSMYEDISRGLQPTYQDVGSLQAADAQLEKP